MYRLRCVKSTPLGLNAHHVFVPTSASGPLGHTWPWLGLRLRLWLTVGVSVGVAFWIAMGVPFRIPFWIAVRVGPGP